MAYGILGASIAETGVHGLIRRLRPSALDSRILREASEVAALVAEPRTAIMSAGEFAKMLDPMHERAIVGCALTSAGPARLRLRSYLDRLREVRPLLTGNDLIEMGVAPGPEVGRLLTAIRRAKRDGAVATRDDELSLVERLISGI